MRYDILAEAYHQVVALSDLWIGFHYNRYRPNPLYKMLATDPCLQIGFKMLRRSKYGAKSDEKRTQGFSRRVGLQIGDTSYGSLMMLLKVG
jgi:hypothetical protein